MEYFVVVVMVYVIVAVVFTVSALGMLQHVREPYDVQAEAEAVAARVWRDYDKQEVL